jgi:phage baseplate assembly protein W
MAHLKTITDYRFEKAAVRNLYQASKNVLQTWEPYLKLRSQKEIQ